MLHRTANSQTAQSSASSPVPAAETAISRSAIPERQMNLFMRFWHGYFVCFLLLGIGHSLSRASVEQRPLRWLLIPLAVLQITLYFRNVASGNPEKMPKGVKLFGYYLVMFALYAAECWIDSSLRWLTWSYTPQLFWTLPPLFTLPLYLLFFLHTLGWQKIASMSPATLFANLSGVIAWMVLSWFIYRLAQSSTERGKLIQELQEAKQQLEHARERDAELAVLKERERMARELHDNLGHSLVTLSVQLEALQRIPSDQTARSTQMLADMKKLVRSSMEGLRHSLDNLRTPGLGEQGLVPSIEQLIQDTTGRTGIKISVAGLEQLTDLTTAVEEVIWRLVQESLANSERHAQATEVRIAFERSASAIVTTIVDNGVGFPQNPETKPGHYGLRGLRERVEGLGGQIQFDSAGATSGARVLATLPLVQAT